MRRVVITGAAGFVGRHLAAEHLAAGDAVVGVTRDGDGVARLSDRWRAALAPVRWVVADFREARWPELDAALDERPDAIAHLAAVSSGIEARRDPVAAWEVNALGTLRLLQAVERRCPAARFVLASSGEVYGAGLSARAREDAPIAPVSPYGASKAAAELVVNEATRRAGMRAVIARAFQQIGPEQRADFVVPAFLGRIAAAKRAGVTTVAVGNLAPRRELVDVRDAARALRLLTTVEGVAGAYNVCGVDTVSLRDLFDRCARALDWACEPREDPAFYRPADIPYLAGDGARLAALGWRPRHALDETLRDIVAAMPA